MRVEQSSLIEGSQGVDCRLRKSQSSHVVKDVQLALYLGHPFVNDAAPPIAATGQNSDETLEDEKTTVTCTRGQLDSALVGLSGLPDELLVTLVLKPGLALRLLSVVVVDFEKVSNHI